MQGCNQIAAKSCGWGATPFDFPAMESFWVGKCSEMHSCEFNSKKALHLSIQKDMLQTHRSWCHKGPSQSHSNINPCALCVSSLCNSAFYRRRWSNLGYKKRGKADDYPTFPTIHLLDYFTSYTFMRQERFAFRHQRHQGYLS